MIYETARARAEWAGTAVPGGTAVLSALTKQIVQSAADFAQQNFAWELVITSILRTPKENDDLYGGHGDHLVGVHTVGRAVDVRSKDVSDRFTLLVADAINKAWVYDPLRPRFMVALYEDSNPGAGSSEKHLHFQTSPNTTFL